nr:EOG090X07KM [Eurycercus lamellatus]
MPKTVETTDGNIPLGSLESPFKTGPDALIIKVPSQQGNRMISTAKTWFNYAACLIFLPISVTGRIIEILLALKQRISTKTSSLEGKVVFITGASSGLGEALARQFYKEGCRLIIASRRYSELERVRNQLIGSSYRKGIVYPPVIIQLDLENPDSLADKMKTVLGVYGHVDILVNNAGISYRGEVISTSAEVDAKLMNVNYFGTVSLTKGLLPSMIERKSGHIVMIGSLQAKLAIPFRSAYAASKHALQAFSDSLRAEVKMHDINVTVINPGYIKTCLSVNALTGDGNKYGKMDETTESGTDPAVAAEYIVQAIKNKTEEVQLCSIFYRLAVLIRVLYPKLFFLMMERRAAKARKTQ